MNYTVPKHIVAVKQVEIYRQNYGTDKPVSIGWKT